MSVIGSGDSTPGGCCVCTMVTVTEFCRLSVNRNSQARPRTRELPEWAERVGCGLCCSTSDQQRPATIHTIRHEYVNETDLIELINQLFHTFHTHAGLSSRVVSASDCGVRGPRFESRHWQLCLLRQLLRYTVLSTGCAPLLQCLGRLSLLPFVGQ